MLSILKLSNILNLVPGEIKAAYRYGSTVYGTANKNSDEDFIIVLEALSGTQDIVFENKINIILHSVETFEKSLSDHTPSALECLWLNQDHSYTHGFVPKFTLNLEKLRASFSAKASNSFVKAKKKFEVEKDQDFYIGKKSLFHSLRILSFGAQIAETGKIHDYTCANEMWADIFTDPSLNWSTYKEKWQPIYNKLSSEFRAVAPKSKR
jgi:predicted nucleotidyltransferase